MHCPMPNDGRGHNGLALDSFRFESLDQLYEMAARSFLGELR